MPPSPQTTKLTSTLHLLIPRLRLLQRKSTASSVLQRRELASLLSENRDASARIRVENVIATDIAVEVMEMVELYCELILARANVLDQIAFGERGLVVRSRVRDIFRSRVRGSSRDLRGEEDGERKRGYFGLFGSSSSTSSSMKVDAKVDSTESTDSTQQGEEEEEEEYIDKSLDEAAAAIFYAHPRFPTDVRELTILRNLLSDRYGKDFMALAQDDMVPGLRVPARLVKGVRVKPPSKELVESYLREIAVAYSIPFGGSSPSSSSPPPSSSSSPLKKEVGEGKATAIPAKSDGIPELDELTRRFAALKK